MRIKGSPIISCLTGPLGGGKGHWIYYTRKGLRIHARRKKRTGGPIVTGQLWEDVKRAWRYLDDVWMGNTREQKALWTQQAKKTKGNPRSGLDYFRHVNIRRWHVGMPPITDPPARPQSIKRRIDNTMHGYSWMPEGKVQPVWISGKKKPEWKGETFDERIGQAPPPDEFTIVSTHGDNGTIFPLGTHTYPARSYADYYSLPDVGYKGKALWVDGVEIPYQHLYLFECILANHTIHVEFEQILPDVITIISTSDAGGTIDPEGEHEYEIGSNVSFEISELANAIGCGIVTDQGEYDWAPQFTFENVQEDHWIQVYNRPVEIEVHLSGYAFGWCFGVVCDDLNFETFTITWAEAPQRWWGTHPNAGECILQHTGPPWDEWQLTVGNWIGVPVACFTQPATYSCTPPHQGWTVEDCCCDGAGNPQLELQYWDFP